MFAPLMTADRRRSLDAGTPDASTQAALDQLTPEVAFAHAKIADYDMAACSIAGVWLLHDFLDESHKLSQDIDTPSGSFWHAIMHRREGDFGNAKYWFRRVGRHPVFDSLGQRAAEMAAERGDVKIVEKLTPHGQWDPFAFVHFCEAAVRSRTDSRNLCIDIQQAEWELLFDYCYRCALGEL